MRIVVRKVSGAKLIVTKRLLIFLIWDRYHIFGHSIVTKRFSQLMEVKVLPPSQAARQGRQVEFACGRFRLSWRLVRLDFG